MTSNQTQHSQRDPEADAWDEFVARAKAIAHSGSMEGDIPPKVKTSQKLKEVREAVLNESPAWQDLVRTRGFSSVKFPIINVNGQIALRNWLSESPDDVLTALQAIWTRNRTPISVRIRSFCERLPSDVSGGSGTRTTAVSQFLMALDVEQYPPYKTEAFKLAYDRTKYGRPSGNADEAELYEYALGFLDRFMHESKARGLELHHRLDAQSLVYMSRESEPWNLAESETSESSAMVLVRPEANLDTLAADLYLTEPANFLHEIDALLTDKNQIIFQGPPGTGKTYVAQRLAMHLAGCNKDRVTLVQFHPSYAYEDFVRGFRPTLRDGQAGFELRDGPLRRAAERARPEEEEEEKKHFLIIDEINRGNLAKVFGELFYLLEYRDQSITLQYQKDGEEDFRLPSNLYIIGTMNTADRSIARVDLALRRRFYFVEFHPDDEPVKGLLRRWLRDKARHMEWVADVVERANELLERDRHAAIGPSYFMKSKLDDELVDRTWKHSVLPYVEELRFGDDKVREEFDLKKLKNEVLPRHDCLVDGLSRLASISREEAVRRIEAEGGTTRGEVSSRWQNWHAAYRAAGLTRVPFQRGQLQTLRQIAERNDRFVARVRMHLVTVINGEPHEACGENVDMDRTAHHYWVRDDGAA